MKPTDVRRATGWMRAHSREFPSPELLSDAVADAFDLYENGTDVPKQLLDIAKEIMHHVDNQA
jgi:hypothetical protein